MHLIVFYDINTTLFTLAGLNEYLLCDDNTLLIYEKLLATEGYSKVDKGSITGYVYTDLIGRTVSITHLMKCTSYNEIPYFPEPEEFKQARFNMMHLLPLLGVSPERSLSLKSINYHEAHALISEQCPKLKYLFE